MHCFYINLIFFYNYIDFFIGIFLFFLKDCCTTLNLTLSNAAYDKQGKYQRAGEYSMVRNKNGENYWVKTDGEHQQAIWYNPEFKEWNIGDKINLNTSTRGIASIGNVITKCPSDEENSWQYWDENIKEMVPSTSGSDIQLKCSGGKQNFFY